MADMKAELASATVMADIKAELASSATAMADMKAELAEAKRQLQQQETQHAKHLKVSSTAAEVRQGQWQGTCFVL